jgi:hypothetical protein
LFIKMAGGNAERKSNCDVLFLYFCVTGLTKAIVLLLPYLKPMKNAALSICLALMVFQGTVYAKPISVVPSITNTGAEDSENLLATNPPFEVFQREKRLEIKMAVENQSGRVFLFDILGNKVLEANANDAIDWSLAGLKSGVYFIVWKDAKASFTKKFLYKQEG